MEFLRKVKGEVKADVREKPILLYDGAGSHCTFNALHTANQLFQPL